MRPPDQQTNASPNFAGLLAHLTRPVAERTAHWLDEEPTSSARPGIATANKTASKANAHAGTKDGDPEADIAALSYERALRMHARYRPVAEPPQTAAKTNSQAYTKDIAEPIAETFDETYVDTDAEEWSSQIPKLIAAARSAERSLPDGIWAVEASSSSHPREPDDDSEADPWLAPEVVEPLSSKMSSSMNAAISTTKTGRRSVTADCENWDSLPCESPNALPDMFAEAFPYAFPDVLPDQYKGSALPSMPAAKTSSITLRTSASEAGQLRQRAREAGLTVSAYIRSCVFEAEALRTEVKAALSELRESAISQASTPPPTTTPDRAIDRAVNKVPAPITTPVADSATAPRRWWPRSVAQVFHT